MCCVEIPKLTHQRTRQWGAGWLTTVYLTRENAMTITHPHTYTHGNTTSAISTCKLNAILEEPESIDCTSKPLDQIFCPTYPTLDCPNPRLLHYLITPPFPPRNLTLISQTRTPKHSPTATVTASLTSQIPQIAIPPPLSSLPPPIHSALRQIAIFSPVRAIV